MTMTKDYPYLPVNPNQQRFIRFLVPPARDKSLRGWYVQRDLGGGYVQVAHHLHKVAKHFVLDVVQQTDS